MAKLVFTTWLKPWRNLKSQLVQRNSSEAVKSLHLSINTMVGRLTGLQTRLDGLLQAATMPKYIFIKLQTKTVLNLLKKHQLECKDIKVPSRIYNGLHNKQT